MSFQKGKTALISGFLDQAEDGIIHPELPDIVPFSLEELMAEGYTASQCLDFVDRYYSSGILPSARQVSPESSYTKSIHSDLTGQSGKYPQYQIRQYVDVFNRDRWHWNLVGHGQYYPTIYGKDGALLRAGCGFLYKDEGLGCLNVVGHPDHKALVKLIVDNCARPQCPECYPKWAGREAFRIDERFRRVPKVRGEDRDKAESRTAWGVPIHLMISVPELEAPLMDLVELVAKGGKFVKMNGFTKLKRRMAKIAKKVGFVGGCTIFHPFASDSMGEDTEIDVKVDPASGEFDWKALIAYFAKQNKELKLWFIRPHFHLIGYGWIKNVAQVHAETGWVVKNLGVRNSVMSTALYQLSHAGYRTGQHTVSWIGCMSNRTFKECGPGPKDAVRVPVCPDCGEVLVPVKWVGEGVSPLDPVSEEGYYYVDPGGWVEIPLDEYRGRIVRPLPGERVR